MFYSKVVGVITQLEAQKKNKDRLSVFVDDAFFCGITLDEAVKNNLVVGLEMSEDELGKLLNASGENDLYNLTLVYILRSPRTERQIKAYLLRKDASGEVAERIIERLKTMNYINDEAYAKMFAEAKHKKMSKRAIKSRLFARGVEFGLIDGAVESIDNESQEELARKVAAKYMKFKENDKKNLLKLNRYLMTKGFEFELVNEVTAEYKKREEVDPELADDFLTYREEYKSAKTGLRSAKRDTKQKKKQFKKLKKKVYSSVSRN